jgi:hypothetical protein
VLDNLVVFTWLRSNRMLIALPKNTARLLTRVAARMNFHGRMIFLNFQIFKSACVFEISIFFMHVMLARSRERASSFRTRLLLYGCLYGGPEWPVFARAPLAAEWSTVLDVRCV